MMAMIGVGGCGMNILEYMADSLPENICTIGVNRDAERLGRPSNIRYRVLLNELSAVDEQGDLLPAGKAEVKTAMQCHWPELKPMLHDADSVCVLVGLGGATGSWASQMIVQGLKKMGKRTILIAVKPFDFERPRPQIAQQVRKSFTSIDHLIICSNQQLVNRFKPDTTLIKAFATMNSLIDEVWKKISQGKLKVGQYRIVASENCWAGSGHPLYGFELVRINP